MEVSQLYFSIFKKVYEGRNKEGDVFAIKAIPKKKSKSLSINN